MPSERKTRTYDASGRRAAAEQTRARVLAAARELFVDQGYAATSVSEIARSAGVSVDTVYATVGRKPQLLLTVVDMVLASSPRPLPASERDYVRAIRSASTAHDMLATYAVALARLMPTVSPLLLALRDAALTDAECARTWSHVVERRARNMLDLAADLRATGDLRDDLDDQDVADLVWSTNSPEFYAAWISRGRSPDDYAATLTDLWSRALIARNVEAPVDPGPHRPSE